RLVPRCHSQDSFEQLSRGGSENNPVCVGYGTPFIDYSGCSLAEFRCFKYISVSHTSYGRNGVNCRIYNGLSPQHSSDIIANNRGEAGSAKHPSNSKASFKMLTVHFSYPTRPISGMNHATQSS